MILTLKDTGVPECVLSGPPQLVRNSVTQREHVCSRFNATFIHFTSNVSLLFSFFIIIIEGELSECHQVIFWAAGRHQAVYVEFTELN